MTQNVQLDYEDPVHEGFFDPIQEMLGAAIPSLNITVLNSTTLKVAASSGNGQQTAAVEGRYRYRTSDITAALPGALGDGIHDVFITASENDFTGPLGDIDEDTVYDFGLEIKAAASTPATALFRKVAEVQVASGAITGFWMIAGPRARGAQQVYAKAEHASQNALRARAAASPTVDITRVENSSGTSLLAVDKDGKLRIGATPTLETSGSTITLTGALKLSSYFAANGKTPAAPPVFTVTNPTTDTAIDLSDYSLNELGNVVGTIIGKLVAAGIFADS